MSQPVATPGAPCWVDLFTSDPAGAEAFYGQLFGWTAEHSGPEYGGYVNFAKGGHAVAGAMANEPASGMPDVWTVYLATGDIEATARAVDAHGGGRPGLVRASHQGLRRLGAVPPGRVRLGRPCRQ